ncbi:MAG: hypothetical protein J6P81_00670 [Spirochaetales bacterium]|nr:hypothetical protein [Spirochaetales bacterium]
MKKSKLILLTVLMVLVLYCGAVIFVTKPDSFAYGAIFGDNGPRAAVEKAQSSAASAETVDTSAIVAEAKDAAVKAAESTVKDLASQTEQSVRRAIEQTLPAMIDSAVRKAVAEQNLSDKIAKQVSEEIESRQAEIASSIYKTYKDSLVDELSTEVIDRTKEAEPEVEIVKIEKAEETEKPVVTLSIDGYDTQRAAIRNAMISSLLNKLED